MDLGIFHLKEPPNFQPFPTYIPDFHHISTIFLQSVSIFSPFCHPHPPRQAMHDASPSAASVASCGTLVDEMQRTAAAMPRELGSLEVPSGFPQRICRGLHGKPWILVFFFYFFFAGYLSKSKKKTRKKWILAEHIFTFSGHYMICHICFAIKWPIDYS